MWFTMVAVAFGGTELEAVTLSADGARAVAVSGIEAAVEIVGTDAGEVRLSGKVEGGDAELTLTRKNGVVVVGVKDRDAEQLSLRLEVPRTIGAVTLHEATGPISARDLPAAIAVVHGVGPVSVEDVASLRVQDVVGPVAAEGLSGGLLADSVTGPVRARDVQGDVKTYDVTGPVDTEAVAGETVEQGGTPTSKSL